MVAVAVAAWAWACKGKKTAEGRESERASES